MLLMEYVLLNKKFIIAMWTLITLKFCCILAIKCNNDPVILEVMAKLGMGFDCASKVRHIIEALHVATTVYWQYKQKFLAKNHLCSCDLMDL